MKNKIDINGTTVLYCLLSTVVIIFIVLYLQFVKLGTASENLPQLVYDLPQEDIEKPALDVGEIIADNDKCFIQLTNIDTDAVVNGMDGCQLDFYFENRTDTHYDFMLLLRGINGLHWIDSSMPPIEAHSNGKGSLFIEKRFLDLYGTDTERFTDIEMDFCVRNLQDPYYEQMTRIEDASNRMGGWEMNGFEIDESLTPPEDAFNGSRHFYPYGKENAVNYIQKRGILPTDKVLLDNDEITVIAANSGFAEDGFFNMEMFAVNKTDRDISLFYNEIYINDIKMETVGASSWIIGTYAGQTAYDTFFLFPYDLEYAGISDIQKIEFVSTKAPDPNDPGVYNYDVRDKKLTYIP